MSNVERYVEAATRANTRRSYSSALRHFEESWGGHLPATADSVARYLADHAGELAINTLKQRLAALAQWHSEQGFADPTRTPLVRKVLKGIQALHPTIEKRAAPLHLTQLMRVADALNASAAAAKTCGDRARELRSLRDRAIVLLGFWRGFRGDELINLQAEHITVVPDQGMLLFLADTKADRQNAGTTFKVPILSRWCPVSATTIWIAETGLQQGPLFRRVDRWGRLADAALHANSLIPLLRRLFAHAGLPSPDQYSGHSLRRGFAGWAADNGWDVKTLMEYVGWKDVHSALRYIESADGFARDRFETVLGIQPERLALMNDTRRESERS
jgi:site-specific recombinase XerD